MKSLKTLVLFIACLSQQACCKTVSQLKREILDQILPKNENEIFVAPGNNTNGVTVVETSLHVLDIEDVNENNLEFTLTLYFRHGWKDHRLKYIANNQFGYVSINDDGVIWTPDTFFVNEKKGHGFDVLRPNVFIKIYPDGYVECSKKVSVTLACPMDFTRFPFDKQQCSVRMESYGSGTDSIILKWKQHSAISISESMVLPLFQVDKLVSSSGSIHLTTVEYSFLNISIYFTRRLSYYVHQVFLPSILIVILSWLPFWLKKQALVARLLVGIGLVMTYTMCVLKFQPKTSYATSMQYFTWMCMTFLVTSLLETIAIHILSKDDDQIKDCVESGNVKTPRVKADFVVLGSRFLVPLIFGLLCFVYFVTNGGFGSDDGVEVPGNKTSEIIVNAF